MQQLDINSLTLVANEPSVAPCTVVLMAGGFGSRLGELTRTLPKPLIPIGGRPLLERLITRMRDMGLTQYVITTHYLPEKIRSHCGDGTHWGCNIRYVQESIPLGTAGGLSLIGGTGDGPVMVCNADILTDIDYADLIRTHESSGAGLTVVTVPYVVTIPFGVLDVSADGTVTDLREKPELAFQVSAGTYVVNPALLDLIGPNERLDMPQFIARVRSAGERVDAYKFDGYWRDIGRPADLKRATDDVEQLALWA